MFLNNIMKIIEKRRKMKFREKEVATSIQWKTALRRKCKKKLVKEISMMTV